jgi:hypothetical protein
MESLFIWIVMFAVAVIVMLGVFLVTSEKELKKKRQELDLVLAKMENVSVPAATAMAAPASPAGDSDEVNRLLAQNQQLERDLAAAASKLESSKLTVDELAVAQRNIEIAKSNAQWLQSTNDQLRGELDDLRKRFEASAAPTQLALSQPDNTDARQRELENEVADLQQQLAEKRAKIRELEAIEHKLENVDAIEMNHREEKRGFEARIAELEQEVSEQALNAHEVESLSQRLAEAERIQQALRDERRSHERELAQWQTRAASAEEQSRQLSALREPFDKLLAKQAQLEERQREYWEALEQFSELVVRSDAGAPPAAGFNEFQAAQPAENHHAAAVEDGLVDGSMIAAPVQLIAAVQPDKKPKRLFGLFPAIIVLAAAGALAVGLWSMNNSGTTAPATVTASALPARPEVKPAAPPVVAADAAEPAPSDALATPPSQTAKPAPAKPAQAARIETNVSGTYEITQASHVYTAPNELAQSMGDIEPGTKVSVVSGKNGWLEIHSKHGRPPGYIRKESARLAAAN